MQHTTLFVVPEIDAVVVVVVVDDFVIHIILIIVLALSRFFFDGLVGAFFFPSPFLVLIFKLVVDAVAVGSCMILVSILLIFSILVAMSCC